MTHLECIWQNKTILVVSILSRNRKIHSRIKSWIGRSGVVIRESKNNQLLVRFRLGKKTVYVSIPPSCVVDIEDIKTVL